MYLEQLFGGWEHQAKRYRFSGAFSAPRLAGHPATAETQYRQDIDILQNHSSSFLNISSKEYSPCAVICNICRWNLVSSLSSGTPSVQRIKACCSQIKLFSTKSAIFPEVLSIVSIQYIEFCRDHSFL